MNVFLSGHYDVAGSKQGTIFDTSLFGNLESFNSMAASAVEESKRDGGQTFVVTWYPHMVTAEDQPVRVGYAHRGQWCWR